MFIIDYNSPLGDLVHPDHKKYANNGQYWTFEDLFKHSPLKSDDNNYPPYNLIEIEKNEKGSTFLIEVAVAGFSEDEIEITRHNKTLLIVGDHRQNEDKKFLHKGVAERRFELKFTLAEYAEVHPAELKNGILTIKVQNVIPEEKQPHKILINSQKASLPRKGSKNESLS